MAATYVLRHDGKIVGNYPTEQGAMIAAMDTLGVAAFDVNTSDDTNERYNAVSQDGKAVTITIEEVANKAPPQTKQDTAKQTERRDETRYETSYREDSTEQDGSIMLGCIFILVAAILIVILLSVIGQTFKPMY